MIVIESLSKVFQLKNKVQVKALDDISLEINDGEIFGIIGMSGAGKSTLIRTINRLEEPSSGKVLVDGLDITNLSESQLRDSRKDIGMIFQHFNLLSSRTVAKNIAFPLEIAGVDRSAAEKRIDELLELVGLSDKKENYPSQLSGGQKQRVAIARALANNPKILLCDEATSALDPKTTSSILGLLKDIRERLGITIVLITHQMEVIREVCDRVAIIEGGKIIELGAVHEVFSNPKTEIAKNFVFGIKPETEIEELFPKVPNSVVVKISYLGDSAKQPIVSKLVRDHNVDINIISGEIDKLMSMSVGHLTMQILGEKESIDSALASLESRNIATEVIWNG